MPQPSIHVLMTGAGAPGAPGILKCLRQEKDWTITLADADAEAKGKFLHDRFFQIPPANAPLFIQSLLELCEKNKINVILPLVTKELIPLALHKEDFEKKGIHVLVSAASSLEIANDKGKTFQFLEWRGVVIPSFRIVENLEQFTEAVKELGYPEKEICFKPCVSNGSRGFRILSGKMNELDLLFNYKPSAGYIQPDEARRILASGKFPELLLMEYLPGDEYSVDCLADHGATVLAVPRLRKKMINGISVEGEIIQDHLIMEYCRQIIAALQLHGNIGIQVKRSASGIPLLLEINPRVQGTISACLGAGVNLPVLAIRQVMGIGTDPTAIPIKWGTRFSRYWEDVFH